MGVTATPSRTSRQLLELYEQMLPDVYGYFLRRCDRPTAEALTEQAFVTAMDIASGTHCTVDGPWLYGIARWTLGAHIRQHPGRHPVGPPSLGTGIDDWDAALNRRIAETVLARLTEPHRTLLMLRYIDDRPLDECADLLHMDLGDTETLLRAARQAFRALYPTGEVG